MELERKRLYLEKIPPWHHLRIQWLDRTLDCSWWIEINVIMALIGILKTYRYAYMLLRIAYSRASECATYVWWTTLLWPFLVKLLCSQLLLGAPPLKHATYLIHSPLGLTKPGLGFSQDLLSQSYGWPVTIQLPFWELELIKRETVGSDWFWTLEPRVHLDSGPESIHLQG